MGNCFGAKQVNSHTSGCNTSTSSGETLKGESPKPQGGGGGAAAESKTKNTESAGKEPARAVSAGRVAIPNLKIFTLAELKTATRNFKPDSVLGEGGFGRVFKGWVDEKTYAPTKHGVGIPIAVKRSYPDHSHRLQEWQSEVKFLGKLTHPNLVKLLGFCWEQKEFLLVYEYMQKGSLENHLFRRGAEPLPWLKRLSIAIGAARGLAFLHSSTGEKQVIYRDFKPSNILLDGDFNPKLSDFGLAKTGPANGDTHVTTRPKGTYGYAAPEYVSSGHLYVKSDVYGFGVVMLELLTGLRAIDTNRPNGQLNLVDWARPSLTSKKKLKKIMDSRLEDRYPMEGAWEAAQLIEQCLESDPRTRPSMDQVLETLEKINGIKFKESKVCSSSGHGTPQNRRR